MKILRILTSLSLLVTGFSAKSQCSAQFDFGFISCESVQFTVDTINPQASYLWNFGDGSSEYSNDPEHYFTVDGTYPVTLTVTDSLNNCVDTLTAWVNVACDTMGVDSCNAYFNYSYVTCDSVWFTAWSYNPSAFYSWDFGDGTGGNGASTAHAFADGSYTISLTVIDSLNNCWNTYTNVVNVWCDSMSVDSCNAWFDSYYVTCDSVWFMPYYYNSSADYIWDFGDGTTSMSSSPAHMYATDGSYTVTLTVIDSLNNCWNAFTNSVYVWCDSMTTDSCNAWFSYYNITCDSVWFMPYYYNSSADYIWDFGDGTTSMASSPAHMYTADGSYTVTLTVVDSLNNCWNSYTSYVDVWCDSTVTDSCNAWFDYYTITCDSVWFMPYFYSPSSDYMWNFGDGTTSYASNPAHAFASDGVYEVTLTVVDSLNNCWNTYTNWVYVWCDSVPVIDSCTAEFDYYFAACDSAVWFGPVVYNPYALYTWNFSDGTTEYGPYINHYFATEGVYTVTLSMVDSMGGCADFVTQTVVVSCDSSFLAVPDEELLSGVNVYPNPSTGIFTIELDAADVTIQVYDLLGNLVMSTACTDDCRYYTVDLTDLANGAYNLVLLKDDRLETRRLVKH